MMNQQEAIEAMVGVNYYITTLPLNNQNHLAILMGSALRKILNGEPMDSGHAEAITHFLKEQSLLTK